MKHLRSPLLLIAIVAAPALIAQAPTFKLGAVYECSGGQSYKIISCAGPKTTDVCEVQSYAGGEPTMRGQSSRQQVTTMLARCHVAGAAAAEKPGAAESKAGSKPPRPGLTSCAGKFEGRYAASNGLAYTITFRSGKAIMSVPLMGNDESECWTSEGKIYLHKAGETTDLEIDVNDDGTLQTPFGELKKKAK